MKKGNMVAIVIVFAAFVYIWKVEQTPKPPVDRTVTTKSSTGTVVPFQKPTPTKAAVEGTNAASGSTTNTTVLVPKETGVSNTGT